MLKYIIKMGSKNDIKSDGYKLTFFKIISTQLFNKNSSLLNFNARVFY
jgi:hypothetical protein